MFSASENMQLVIMAFSMVTAAFMMSYFRLSGDFGRKVNVVLEILLAAAAIFYPKAVVMIPLVAYEAVIDRQIAAGIASFIALSGSYKVMELKEVILLLLITLLSAYLSYRTERMSILEKDNRLIRDEGEIKKEVLNERNRELLAEQDKNIYMAQLAERNRIAREIHDNVGHMLSRSILQVGAMMVVHKDGPIADELKSLRETLDTAMNNIRSSVHDIRDEAIKLDTALEEIADPLKGKYKVSFEFDADAENISKEIKYATINIVKEAVSNIIKYSVNEYVDIRFYEHPSMYQIVVHDYNKQGKTGSGDNSSVERKNVSELNSGGSSGDGMGLENIRTRAEKLGGNATITNENGFRVFVRIPK